MHVILRQPHGAAANVRIETLDTGRLEPCMLAQLLHNPCRQRYASSRNYGNQSGVLRAIPVPRREVAALCACQISCCWPWRFPWGFLSALPVTKCMLGHFAAAQYHTSLNCLAMHEPVDSRYLKCKKSQIGGSPSSIYSCICPSIHDPRKASHSCPIAIPKK